MRALAACLSITKIVYGLVVSLRVHFELRLTDLYASVGEGNNHPFVGLAPSGSRARIAALILDIGYTAQDSTPIGASHAIAQK